MLLADLKSLLRGVRNKPYHGRPGFTALCPVCQDSSPKTSSGHLIAFEGNDGQARIKCTINGCLEEHILASLGESSRIQGTEAREGAPDHVWDYVDQAGRYLFSKAKWNSPKRFRQGVRRLDGRFEWNLLTVSKERPLYRLPELLDALEQKVVIHLCEGEKAVDRLYLAGLIATCQSDGAGNEKLRDHHVEILSRATKIVIWADRDEVGVRYAIECAEKLRSKGIDVQVVQSRTEDDHSDAFDHFEAGFGIDDAVTLKRSFTEQPTTAIVQQGRWSGFLSVAEILSMSQDEPDWVWEGILPVGGVGLFCAKPKVGKSTFLRHFALAISRGEPFLERATKQGRVLYLAIEESPQIVGAEIRRVGWLESDQIKLRFGSAPMGDHRQIVQELGEFVRAGDYAVLIVDTIGRLARVRQGNDYAEVTQALEPVVDLARHSGCAVVLTHHLGKSERDTGDGALGSTAYFAAVDVCIDMKKVDGVRVLDSIGRAGQPFEGQTLSFDPETHRVSISGQVSQLQTHSVETRILDEVLAAGPMSREELKRSVGGNATRFSDALRSLLEAGRLVVVSGQGTKGSPKLLGLPEACSGTAVELEPE